jgi:catechol 2,3-dioxygenase-like lactoylglutathione lyase family enzyme
MPLHDVEGTLESALYATDLEAAEAFYAGTLGLPVLGRLAGRHVFFAVGRSVLLVFNPTATLKAGAVGVASAIPRHGATGPGHYCFCIARGRIGTVAETLGNLGIAIEADIRWPEGARSIYVRDPAGNSIEFAEATLWFDDT